MTFTDVLVGGVWVASAVKVGSYTWQSYTNTYNRFPGIGGGDSGGFQPLAANKSAVGATIAAEAGVGSPGTKKQSPPGGILSPIIGGAEKFGGTIGNAIKSLIP